jgi:BA14K-like protein
MEPTMINLKILSTVAALALVLPMAVPSASFAQHPHGGGHAAGGHPSGGGHPGGFHPGGGGGHFSGGGGGYRGGYHGGGGGGFIPGAVAGALVGGAIAAGAGGYGYYGGPGYDQGYYGGDPGYYDDGAVAVAPEPAGDDGTSYCMQRFRSYDPQSGTYMGNDGYRHPCP